MSDLLSKLKSEIASFDESVVIAKTQKNNDAKYLKKDTGGYIFNQAQTLNLIDLYYNSKFESGLYDSEGQRKVFLNIGKFRSDVAAKQTDLDVKDYTFVPENYASIWKVWFMKKQFGIWAKKEGYGQLINDLNKDYSKYGTCVVKRVGKKLERVPLKSLKNTQDAKSLFHAATTGGFVIEEHEYSEYELKKFTDWKLDGIDFEGKDKICVYERYGLLCQDEIDEFNGKKSEDETPVLTMAICSWEKTDKKDEYKSNILYLQKISEKDFPYDEAHWDKQDGRWLGIGEVENQFENQIARNTSANLRRRSMLWASKHLFQSTDDAINKNLIKEVRDGQIITIAPNGNITPIDMTSRALPDFNAEDSMWEQNSNQRSFTFEVATGESLPSGTPFRLGVLLSDATQTHFKLKRENFGLFLTRAYFNQLIPIFRKDIGDHVVTISGLEDGIEPLMESIKQHYVWQEFKRILLSGQVPVLADLQAQADSFVKGQKFHFFDIVKGWYDDAVYFLDLEITGEGSDNAGDAESLTNLYKVMVQDPTVSPETKNRVLEMALAKTGKNMKEWIGSMKANIPAPLPQPSPTQPNVNVQPQPIIPQPGQ